MTGSPTTHASLLVRLRNPQDEEAWGQFVAIYTPLVERVARARGLQAADAADVTQDVFRAVAGAIERYDPDPSRGSFRGWLFRIARNLAINLLTARGRQIQGSGDTDVHDWLEAQPAPDAEETLLFDAEYRQRVFRWAAERVRGEFRERTWQAFWLTSVDGRTPQAAAEGLGLSVGAVYVARSRVMSRLREVVEGIECEV